MTAYLIATVDTDVKPWGEYRSSEIVPSGEVRDHLHGILSGHGRIAQGLINGQMVQEAETAMFFLDRWRGEPMRLCGYLTRIDVYPVPGNWDHAGEEEWRILAGQYDDHEQRQQERAAEQRIRDRIERTWHLPADDPDYPDVLAYLTEAQHYTSLDAAVAELGRFHALAVRPDVVAAMYQGYRTWQWAVGAAVKARGNHETAAQYEAAMLAEISEER